MKSIQGGVLCVLALCFYSSAFSLSFKELNKILKTRDVNWIAKDSGIHEILKLDAKRTSVFGLIDTQDVGGDEFIKESTDIRSYDSLPLVMNWTNFNGFNWISPVKNQASCGSCVAFAAIATLEGTLNIAAYNPTLNLDLSEQYLFSNIGYCNFGAWPSLAMYSLKKVGVPDESCFPYISGREGEDFASSLACQDVNARQYKINEYFYYTKVDDIKAALTRAPLFTTMNVYEDFMFYGGGIYKHVAGNFMGGHAVTIVGYDDTINAWIGKNSWGTVWGENGYFKIAYDDASSFASYAYEVKVDIPDIKIILDSPKYLDAAKDYLNIKVSKSYNDSDISSLTYMLINKDDPSINVQGDIALDSLTAELDISMLSDGIYELIIIADTGKNWYSTIIVANQHPQVDISISALDFDFSKPISKRVYFGINVNYNDFNTTLTDIVFHIEKTDGTLNKIARLENVGTKARYGWRTPLYPDGEYKIWAQGRIGDLYTYYSNTMIVNVKNSNVDSK